MTSKALMQIGLQDDEDIDLADAGLLLAAADRPDLDLAPYREHLISLTSSGKMLAQGLSKPYEQAMLLSYVMARRHGYKGDAETYDSPQNSNLIDVIDRKRGLPVALSILYISVARSLGWAAQGLNTPGHFVIQIGKGKDAVLQDPFDGGRQLTPQDLKALIEKVNDKAGEADPGEGADPRVETMTNRAILVRLLNNEAARAEHGGALDRALILHERMTTIAPEFSALWWERARLEQVLGHVKAARSSLVAMQETTIDDALSERIRQMLEMLARSIN